LSSGTFYPSVSGDDGSVLSSNFFYGSADSLPFGNEGNYDDNAMFVRFAGVTIPQGVTITSAVVKLTAYSSLSGDPIYSNCHFEDADNPAAPTSAGDYQGRSLTAGIAWDNVTAWTDGVQYDTPSLTSILQTVTNRVGWASGQAVLFSIENDGTSNGDYRFVSSIDYSSGAEKAELHVEWTDPNVDVEATTATLTITPNAANVNAEISFTTTAATLTITANQADVSYGTAVNANTAVLTVSAQPATIINNVNLLAECAILTLASNVAEVSLGVSISATSPSLIITSNAATVALSIKGTLALKNSLYLGSTLSLVNSLNVVFNGDITLALDILSKIEGTQTLRLDIENLAKFNDTLSLINHILDADSGITQGDYYFLKNHGI